MKTLSPSRLDKLALVFLAMLTPAVADQGASAKIEAEVEHLRKALDGKPDADPQWKEAKPDIRAALQHAADDARSGRLYVSLEALSEALASFRGFERATEKTEEQLLKDGLPGVEAEVKKARVELAAFDHQNWQESWGNSPVAIRALSEKGEGEAANLISGGRGFAAINDASLGDRANDFSSALYYVGSAEAQSEIAILYETLKLPRNGSLIPLRSVSPELQRLQEQTTAAFQPPRSVEHHSDFISLNATLKLAGELDSSQHFAGALYQYLDAVQQFGMLDAVLPDAAKQSELKRALGKMRDELTTSSQDSSIAQLFLERAETRLTGSPGAKDWQTAQIVVEQVLPAYVAVLKSAPPQGHPVVAEVTVTLVRWPYT
jgi:hypothetical protein